MKKFDESNVFVSIQHAPRPQRGVKKRPEEWFNDLFTAEAVPNFSAEAESRSKILRGCPHEIARLLLRAKQINNVFVVQKKEPQYSISKQPCLTF
jgi:hypothetical protein